jgi:hypothetical protein
MSNIKLKQKTISYKELYESLSFYVKLLDRRVTYLEATLQINTNLKNSNKSVIGTERIKAKQNTLYAANIITILNNYFKVELFQWLNKSRKTEILEIRYLFFWLLMNKYNINNPITLQNLLLQYSYKIDRTTFYNVKNNYEKCITSFSPEDKKLFRIYKEIYNQL